MSILEGRTRYSKGRVSIRMKAITKDALVDILLRGDDSYRIMIDSSVGQLFRPDRTYKDWLNKQQDIIAKNKRIKKVVSTDISDFYARINFHRLENLLDEVAPGSGAARFIKKHIKVIRAKQSFGLPVGGSAARILAELALADTDQALADRGILATRFVDDFRILLKQSDDPYDALGFLAEQLGINEGLSLNAAKTYVTGRRQYVRRLENLTTDVAEEAEGVALDVLTANLYFDDDPDLDDLEKLRGLNLVEYLENELGAQEWDTGRIKVIFRALKLAKPKQAIEFIKENFATVTVFAKEICLLMEALQKGESGCFESLAKQVIEAIRKPPASSVQLIRTWLLEIFVRGVIKISLARLKELEYLPAPTDKRQILLIRGRLGDVNYFRRQKTGVSNFSDLELSSLVWGASCLPRDEYEKWVDTIKPNFSKPLGVRFLRWCAKNRDSLISRLHGTTIDHPD